MVLFATGEIKIEQLVTLFGNQVGQPRDTGPAMSITAMSSQVKFTVVLPQYNEVFLKFTIK